MRSNPRFRRSRRLGCRLARSSIGVIILLLVLLAGGAGLTWGILKYRNRDGQPAKDTAATDNAATPPDKAAAASEVRVLEVRTQKIGETVYFEAILQAPDDLRMPKLEGEHSPPEIVRRTLAGLPRLLPRDRNTAAVCLLPSEASRQRQLPNEKERTLVFVGKAHMEGSARLRLLYPTGTAVPAPKGSPLAEYLHAPVWGETTATLDFAKASRLDPPRRGNVGDGPHPPAADDLEGRWAQAQAYELAVRETQAPGFGFYRFARQALERKHQLPTTELTAAAGPGSRPAADAAGSPATRQARTRDIQQLTGISLAAHPWKSMIGDRTPAQEPLAAWTPNDNYYAGFHRARAYLDLAELLERLGGGVLHTFEPECREGQVRARYEKQLCLPFARMAARLGSNLVRNLAVSGSDPYWSEGTDISVLFHVADRKRFLDIVDPFVQEARDKFGAQLVESKSKHKNAAIESYVTPLREVSLHRASVDDVVIYSNSLPALQRILDAHANPASSLLHAEDYRYVRTVFRSDDKEEDGFVFLSDAFLRRLLSPASRIKEQRRSQALASLTLAHHAALFHAWQTGRLPSHQKELLAQSALDAAALRDPESEEVTWNAEQQIAVSKIYGTRNFLTPLVELSIARVTPDEEKGYRDFAAKFESSWQHFLDPAGFRLALRDRQLRIEAHMLPEIRAQGNEWLRQFLGGKTTAFDLRRLPPQTVFQFLSAWSGESAGTESSKRAERWGLLALEDAPAYATLIDWWLKREFQTEGGKQLQQDGTHLLWRLPLTLGLHVPGDKDGTASAREGEKLLRSLVGNFSEEKIDPYRGVAMTQIHLNERRGLLEAIAPDPNAALYHARIDDAWYVSLSQDALHHLIEQSARSRGQKSSQSIQVAASALLAPQALQQSSAAVLGLLEWESHRRALANGPVWYALYRGGLLTAGADETAQQRVASRLLGFVPSSPDGAEYRYDADTDDVLNTRHGSYSRPRLGDGQDEQSVGRQLLGSVNKLRVDLRLRSDRGVDKTHFLEEVVRVGGKIKGDALDLSGAKISDGWLTGLEAVPHLKRLNLRSTPLTDSGLDHLAVLKELQVLDLTGTRISDAGLEKLHGLKSLERIVLNDTKVTDRGVAQFRVKMPGLRAVVRRSDHEEQLGILLQSVAPSGGRMEIERDKAGEPRVKLNFFGAKITNKDLAKLEDLELVSSLDLAGARQISDTGIAALEKAVHLRTLDLSRTSSGDDAMKHLSKLTDLRELVLADTPVTDSGLASLKDLHKLERLDLGGDAISDAGVAHLKDLTQLRELSLYFTRVTDDSFAHLQRLTRLEKINLRGTRMTAAGIDALQRALPRAAIVRDRTNPQN